MDQEIINLRERVARLEEKIFAQDKAYHNVWIAAVAVASFLISVSVLIVTILK